MATISNLTIAERTNGFTASGILDGIQFNSIGVSDGQGLAKKWNRTDGPWSTSGSTTLSAFAVNAVDIDWNGATLGSSTINTTGELLSWIKSSLDSKVNTYRPVQIGVGASQLAIHATDPQTLIFTGGEYINVGWDSLNHAVRFNHYKQEGTSAKAKLKLWKTKIDHLGHSYDAEEVTKEDITALGIPSENTTYSAGNKLKLTGNTFDHDIPATSPAKVQEGIYKLTIDEYGHITSASAITADDLRMLLDDVYALNESILPFNQNLSILLDDWTYGDTANQPVVSGNSENSAEVFQYKSTEPNSIFTNAVPQNAGTYIVKVIIEQSEIYRQSWATDQFTIHKANLSNLTVSMSGWVADETPANPVVSGNTGNGTVTYEYKVNVADDSTYSSTKPTTPGTYIVRATVAETTNYNGGSAATNFTISPSQVTYSYYLGTLTEAQVTDQTTVDNLTYNQTGNKPSTITVPSGYPTQEGNYLVFIYPESWGTPTIKSVNGYGTGDASAAGAGISNPSGKVLKWWMGDYLTSNTVFNITWS